MNDRYGLPEISTSVIVRVLDARVGDYLHDSDPQHDSFFEDVPKEDLQKLENVLRNVLKEFAHTVVERVQTQALDGYELARSED
jgi:hypothetical protein